MSKSIEYDRDKNYWNEYYKKLADRPIVPSKFANDIIGFLEKDKRLLELGCGNGRDSLFFWQQGLLVTGIDASDYSIKMLNEKYVDEKIRFVCDDFVSSILLRAEKFDYCYARWVIHAINQNQEHKLLDNIYHALEDKGRMFIEVRTIRDDIYGRGECIGRHEFLYNDHYRRFIVPEEFIERIESHQFRIVSMEEGKGFAPAKDSDPTLLRLIVEKY